MVLNGDYLWIHDGRGNLLIKVKRSMNRLYKIILQNNESRCLLSKCDDGNWLWHSRLGHVNFKAMLLMSTTHMVHGLPKISQPKEVCTGCLMSKQTRRKLFPSKASYCATKALELVHGDLCGPVSPGTPTGNKYIFLLVYDYTRVMGAYLLKNKDEAFEAFKRFRALVENNLYKKIKTFRMDRGGEFSYKEFILYCQEVEITRHFSAP